MNYKLHFTICLLGTSLLYFQCSDSKSTSENAPPPKSLVKKTEVMDPMKNKGIGPVSSVVLSADIDETMAANGKVLFEKLCTACHKSTKKFIGSSPKDILKRRSPEWAMNMIMNPDEMILEDPIAKQLLIEANGAPMANQNVSEEDARMILEYFRTL